MSDRHPKSGWILSCGKAGHDVQCIGVMRSLDIPYQVIGLQPSGMVNWFSPWLRGASEPQLHAPWPDIVIASGRQTIPYARTIRRRSNGNTFTVILQDPVIHPRHFDLVWVNAHDHRPANNLIATATSPHMLTAQNLETEGARFAPLVADLPRPLVGVLIGGQSRAYQFDTSDAERLCQRLVRLAQTTGCSLAVTFSRRTGHENEAVIRRMLAQTPAWIWNGAGHNPYPGLLGHCDAFIVTCDSVNMIGEAAYTSQPVYAYRLPGGKNKFDIFHQSMQDAGIMRWFDDKLENWQYDPPHANPVIAEEIKRRFADRALSPG